MGSPAFERRLIERAVELGRAGWGAVHPNPMVGCVLADGERVIAESHHREFGGPHAEAIALERAEGAARGATAYVSLEPCNHRGKTPPCSEALIAAGIRRVVFAAPDPGSASGGGGDALRGAGLSVEGPLWDLDRARAENPAFYHREERGTPWVALKLARSMDGRIAEAAGERTRITGAEAERWTHRLRSGFDAVLVGSATARIDDPRLNLRHGVGGRAPARVVMDSDARLSPAASLFSEEGGPVVVVTAIDASEDRTARLEDAGARVVRVRRGPRGLDEGAALAALGVEGLGSILCEGGGALGSSLLRAGLVERLYLLTSGRRLGAGGVPDFDADLPERIWAEWRPHGPPQWLGGDRLSVYRRSY